MRARGGQRSHAARQGQMAHAEPIGPPDHEKHPLLERHAYNPSGQKRIPRHGDRRLLETWQSRLSGRLISGEVETRVCNDAGCGTLNDRVRRDLRQAREPYTRAVPDGTP